MKAVNQFGELLKGKLEYLTALISFILFLTLSVTDIGEKLEYSMYDAFLHIKPEVKERTDILLVNIDDLAIEEVGAWPWTRDVIADAIIRLREVGGEYVVFDIEYMTPSQSGVNREYVKKTFPKEYSEVQSEISQYLQDFSTAIADKTVPLSYVNELGSEMAEYIDGRMSDLSSSITGNIFRDNDLYFANSIRFFGKTFLTINSENIAAGDSLDSEKKYARENFLFTFVVDPMAKIHMENIITRRDSDYGMGIAPAILPLLQNAAGAGFPNVIIDEDGVRRRIELLVEYEGAYVAQLVFSPILHILNPDRIVRRGSRLVLENAKNPDNLDSTERINISIPLDENGRFLINWLKKKFAVPDKPELGSFTNYSLFALRLADIMEEKLLDNLNAIKGLGIKTSDGFLSYHDAVLWLLGSYDELLLWKVGLLEGDRTDYDDYFAARTDFFANYKEFLDGGYDSEIYDVFDTYAKTTGEVRFSDMKRDIEANFTVYRNDLLDYTKQFENLVKMTIGKFCIIGYSGLGTSDLGVNPFEKLYPNVGTHANIYNTIMSREFINPLPLWFSWLLALCVCMLSALAFRRIKLLKQRLLYGIISSFLVFAGLAALFSVFRIYIHVLVPLFSIILTFIMVSLLKFIFSEQEKSFLRKAFTMYLSSDVVNQIVDNPSLLKLGGEEKKITALFTDIKSFSTLSEKVTPEHLVEILNKYLTAMSDIVLEQKGTIDKYIGDAIVSFFGAPLDLPDHASRACLAAVRMKQVEENLNKEMLASNFTPMPIMTRIGINTGSMVVGNMGTDNKMNYTIMGNDVNLAARLEGVNKAYGTWILVSESTWNETNGMFLGRRLDRVRVVGINTPVQLYNVMAVRSEASGRLVNLVDKFEQGIDAYREKRFAEALVLFTKCTEIDPDDEASKLYLERIKRVVKDGVSSDWTDIVNMTSK